MADDGPKAGTNPRRGGGSTVKCRDVTPTASQSRFELPFDEAPGKGCGDLREGAICVLCQSAQYQTETTSPPRFSAMRTGSRSVIGIEIEKSNSVCRAV